MHMWTNRPSLDLIRGAAERSRLLLGKLVVWNDSVALRAAVSVTKQSDTIFEITFRGDEPFYIGELFCPYVIRIPILKELIFILDRDLPKVEKITFQMEVSWRGNAFSDAHAKNIKMSFGPWDISQSLDDHGGAGKAYTDRIKISKAGTKGWEYLRVYMDQHGCYPPYWEIVREGPLEGISDADVWTDRELRLTELMDCRNEIVLDGDQFFPIMKHWPNEKWFPIQFM